jgi:aspartate aminotransferase-like enzyme
MTKRRLLTPGPTMLPDAVYRAIGTPFPHHRTEEFRRTIRSVIGHLKDFYQTSWPIVPLTCSGTGGLETAVVNLVSPGEKAVVVRGGKFGERWGEICDAWGIAATHVDVEWGRSVDPAAVEKALDATPGARALFVTHSETSTGALHDVEALSGIARRFGVLFVVDAITSLLIHDLRTEKWNIDVVVTGSQKALMVPPGMAFLSVSPRALEAARRSKSPRYYFDLAKAVESLEEDNTPWTTAISLVFGLGESLAFIAREGGLEGSIRRHARAAAAVRASMRALGIELFAARPSNALTACLAPGGIDSGALIKKLDADFGVRFAGGQGAYKGKIFRIGHMGYFDDLDLLGAVHALERTLDAMGWKVARGAGLTALQSALWDAPER